MRAAILVSIMLVTAPAFAQVKAYQSKPAPRATYQRQQPFDAMAKDTTPFNCEQYRNHPYPRMQRMCAEIESNTLDYVARTQGKPAPSSSVIELPALGTLEAKQLGYACIGGQAMRRLKNGWEQVMSRAGGWQRCTGG